MQLHCLGLCLSLCLRVARYPLTQSLPAPFSRRYLCSCPKGWPLAPSLPLCNCKSHLPAAQAVAEAVALAHSDTMQKGTGKGASNASGFCLSAFALASTLALHACMYTARHNACSNWDLRAGHSNMQARASILDLHPLLSLD